MGLDHSLTITMNDGSIEEIHWRKKNHFHAWFADNASKFEDNSEFEVSKDELTEFINTCKKILEDNSLGEVYMPTRNGFFFGSTNYDEYYYESIQRAIDKLEEINQENILSIIYWSWW